MVATKGLSVRETERVVQRLQEPAAVKAKPREDRDILQLQEELSERLGAAVSIRSGAKGKGKLVIAYSSLDQLDGILARLR
jgi:ParB family chromosome partitioning protein